MNKSPTGRTLAGGMAWIGGFRWSAQVLSWVATLVVIRLLAPEDYGIAGLATAFIGVAAILSELGLGTAVVALPSVSPAQAAQMNTAAVGAGIGFASLISLAAPFAAGFFGEPALRLVLPVLSLSFILEGVRTVPVALLARRLAYRTTAAMDFARALTTTGSVLLLAVLGWGYWALILGNVAGGVFVALWVLARHRVPLARPKMADLAVPITFAKHIVAGRALWQVYRTADMLIVGRLLGTVSLGFYSVAWNVASLPGEKLGNVITAATAPFFAAVQHDRERLRHYFLKVTGVMAMVLFPVLFGFLVVADLAVPVVLGEKWLPTVPLIQVLVANAALTSVTLLLPQILNVTGHTRTAMLAGVVCVVVLLPAFAVGALLSGTLGVAMAWLVTFPLITWLPLKAVLVALNLKLVEYLQEFRPAVEGSMAILVAASATRWAVADAPGGLVEMILTILAGIVAFGLVLRIRHPSVIHLAQSLRAGPASASETGDL